jgi:hypothetical protein
MCPRHLSKSLKELPAQRRKPIEQRSADLIQEQLTLRQLRRDLNLTQDNVTQRVTPGVSRNTRETAR